MTRIIGHRGARNEAPENTIEGFVHAQLNGCNAFELDVRLSKDHQLMVFHDSTLFRMTGIPGLISSFTEKQLRRMCVHGYPNLSLHHIPSLSEVVASVPDTIDWQFEVKATSRAKMRVIAIELDKFIAQAIPDNVRVTITSSSIWFLKEIKQRSADLHIGYVAEYKQPDPVKTAHDLGCSLLAINDRLCDQKLVELAHSKEIELSVWTVNDLTRMAELKQMSVDSIITDIPSRALKL